MRRTLAERHRLSALGWVATVAVSLAFYPALADRRFLAIGLLFAAVPVAVGMGLRALRVPTLAVFLTQVAALLELAFLWYGGHNAYGVVPTPGSYHALVNQVQIGMEVAQAYAAPAPASPGLTLAVVGYIGAVALLVDLFVAGLDRVPVAGLPLLALYTVPVAVLPNGVPVICFVPGAVAFLVLLLVGERDKLLHWGRHVVVGSGGDGHLDMSGVSSTGRRVSVFAVVLAVVVPAVLPAFGTNLIPRSPGIGGTTGTGSLSFRDPMVSLAHSLHETRPVDMMTVQSAAVPEYLRLVVLDNPTPDGWRPRPVDLSSTYSLRGRLPRPVGLSSAVATTSGRMTVVPATTFPSDTGWLPVPFAPDQVDITGGVGCSTRGLCATSSALEDWAFNPPGDTVAAVQPDALSRVQSYTVSYQTPEPTVAQLEDAGSPPPRIVARFQTVPKGVPAFVVQTARSVTASANNSYQRGLLLQDFFRNPSQFSYDLNVGYGDGYQAMAKFLRQRKGYCQQFAATMAMMARVVGIPARVVVGFLRPTQTSGPSGYVFTSRSAHSWPELYFAGVGWVRFEPTPRAGTVVPSYAPLGRHVGSAPPPPAKTTPLGQAGHFPGKAAAPTKHIRTSHASAPTATPAPPSRAWLLLLLLVLVIFTPALLRVGIRRNRLSRPLEPAAAAESAWHELRDHVVDLRLAWTGSLTPRARSRVLEPMLGGDPDGVSALDRLSLTVERARYASTPFREAAPGADARVVMGVLSREVGSRQRLRAALWPSSLLPDLRAVLERWRTALPHRG